jgi:hypothetical protein
MIPKIRSVLEKNPWYETRWKAQLEKLQIQKQDEMLFMLATRWADDIRTRDPAESHPLWHYVDFPFACVRVRPGLTAIPLHRLWHGLLKSSNKYPNTEKHDD